MSGAVWRAVDRPVVNVGTGAEQLARATVSQIAANLATQCNVQDELWAQRDADWAQLMGRPNIRTKVIRVPKERIYLGARPSLVESRFELWPAITVRAANRDPSDDREQLDQYSSLDIQLVIEVLASTGPYQEVVKDRDPDDEIDRQYQRLSDAVKACIDLDTTIGGHVLPIKRPPRMRPSLPFARKMDKGSGPYMLYQGMQLTYTVTALTL